MAAQGEQEPRRAAGRHPKLAACVALAAALAGATMSCRRLYGRHRAAIARALAADRRRTAADVHDLVMQELSMALAGARTLADDPQLAPTAGAVVTAGERALAGARGIVMGLSERDRAPLSETVRSAVLEAARGRRLSFDTRGEANHAHADRETSDALVHIGREAVTNAIKHGRASSIEVVLDRAEEWQLTVRDDGLGFAPRIGRRGFGLGSMRRCAAALGGVVSISSRPGSGTTVEARLP